MRLTLILSLSIIIISSAMSQKNFHSFSAETIDGETIELSKYAGKKVLVVNTASKCGYTPQYEELQSLYEKYGGEKFEIIGFPANDFLKQEPGSDEEIKSFCQKNYGVTFQMMSKITVKGKDIDPIYAWLTSKEENGILDAPVKWNFQKFLIDEKGNLVTSYAPGVSPLGGDIEEWIKDK